MWIWGGALNPKTGVLIEKGHSETHREKADAETRGHEYSPKTWDAWGRRSWKRQEVTPPRASGGSTALPAP